MAATIAFGILLPTVGGDADLWGGYLNTSLQLIANNLGTRTTDYNFADFLLQRPILQDYAEKLQTVTFSATPTIDLTLGNHAQTTLTADITAVTISNPSPTGNLCVLRWYLKQDGTGTRLITWPAAFKWSGGVTPQLNGVANRTDILTAITRDAGTTWDARLETSFVGL